LINEFLAKLPNDNRKINELVEEIKKHQKRYYDDLILELNMNEDKKEQLRRLWKRLLTRSKALEMPLLNPSKPAPFFLFLYLFFQNQIVQSGCF